MQEEFAIQNFSVYACVWAYGCVVFTNKREKSIELIRAIISNFYSSIRSNANARTMEQNKLNRPAGHHLYENIYISNKKIALWRWINKPPRTSIDQVNWNSLTNAVSLWGETAGLCSQKHRCHAKIWLRNNRDESSARNIFWDTFFTRCNPPRLVDYASLARTLDHHQIRYLINILRIPERTMPSI